MLKKFSEKIGFTPTEIKVILFLIIIFTVGFGAKYLFLQNNIKKTKIFDYSEQDSLFENIKVADSTARNKEIDVNVVDYKQEVLDFNTTNFKNSKEVLPAEKSININTASIKELITLPGIGEKTAGSIVNFRKKIIKFQKLEDILNVKGIGTSKLNKIKKYIYIE